MLVFLEIEMLKTYKS